MTKPTEADPIELLREDVSSIGDAVLELAQLPEQVAELQRELAQLKTANAQLAGHVRFLRYVVSDRIAQDHARAEQHAATRTRLHQEIPDPLYRYAKGTVFGRQPMAATPPDSSETTVGIRGSHRELMNLMHDRPPVAAARRPIS